MAIQFKLLSANNKVQFARKDGVLTDVDCINDNTKTCKWSCRAFPEPVSLGGLTYITFTCGNGMVWAIPDADFSDSR